jgi:hypothetical protein
LENYELSEGRSPGETTLSDIPAVLASRKDMCDNMVNQFFIVLVKIIFLLIFTWCCELQSLSESHIPTALIERLVAAGKKEHPPVCAILGGILGQVGSVLTSKLLKSLFAFTYLLYYGCHRYFVFCFVVRLACPTLGNN